MDTASKIKWEMVRRGYKTAAVNFLSRWDHYSDSTRKRIAQAWGIDYA